MNKVTSRRLFPPSINPGILALLIVCGTLLIPRLSLADPFIDFGGLTGGLFEWNGTNAVGINIPISGMSTFGLAANPCQTAIGCSVTNGATGTGVLNFNTATNSVILTGAVPALSIGSTNLIQSGSFTKMSFVLLDPISNTFGFTATGSDAKAPALLTALGIPLTPDLFTFVGVSLTGTSIACPVGTPAGVQCFNIASTDYKDTPVPEPTSLLLLGSALAGLGAWRLRRMA
jgi:PEP-CTERM motif-containing protein